MSFIELFITCFSLSLDAFSVSICKGISIKKITLRKVVKVAAYFTVFQVLMPFYGYFLGNTCYQYIACIDHYIIFILLGIIGLNMISEGKEQKECNDSLDIKTMLLLSIATSIDALAAGITFDFLDVSLKSATILVGTITFIMCSMGVLLGKKIGTKFQRKASILGGILLISLGFKTLITHILL